jgi:hypothetical protein
MQPKPAVQFCSSDRLGLPALPCRYTSKQYFDDVHRTSQPYLAFKVGVWGLWGWCMHAGGDKEGCNGWDGLLYASPLA